MENYINISPQEVEEMAYPESKKLPGKLAQDSFRRGYRKCADDIATKANTQLTPILDEAVRVMEGQLKIEKLAAEHLTTDINHQRISDLEKSIKNIKALKG